MPVALEIPQTSPAKALQRSWPLTAAAAVYAGAFILQLWQVFLLTRGRQLYPLDDVYIHAAVAKNLVLHHVYGVNPFQSSFPSSSIFWPFLLAAVFMVVGVHAWVPLALNVCFSLLCLAFAAHFLTVIAPALSARMRFACLMLLVFGTPLIGISFEGMEHVLQTLSFLVLFFCYFRERTSSTRVTRILLAVSAGFAVGVRYEGLFAVLMIGLLLMWRRKWTMGFGLAVCSLAPVVAFGLFAKWHGSTFLPSPLLLKTSASAQTGLSSAAVNLTSRYSQLSGITVCSLISALFLCYLSWKRQWPALRELFLILTGTFLLHAQLAHFGWLFRYEAYLLATTVVLTFTAAAVVLDVRSVGPRGVRTWLQLAMVLLFAVALAGRALSMLRGIPRNARAIYEQQYQTARFLNTYYPGQVVGLNDIGAPDFFADVRSVDMLGLASNDVATLRRTGAFSRTTMTELAQRSKMRIAVLYPGLFAGQIPADWISVSSFVVADLPGKVQLGERRVTLYATSAAEATILAGRIAQFRSQLPSGVLITSPEMPLPAVVDRTKTIKSADWIAQGISAITESSAATP